MNARVLTVMVTILGLLWPIAFATAGRLPTSGDANLLCVEEPAPTLESAHTCETLQNEPLMFIENVGQFDGRARFQVRGGIGTTWLMDHAIWITLLDEPSVAGGRMLVTAKSSPHTRGVHLQLSFVGANPHPRLEPFGRSAASLNYLLGDDPGGWRTDVPVWSGVRYVDLYPGIDLELGGEAPLRLVARAGADLSTVRVRVEGANGLTLDGNHLLAATAVGDHALPWLVGNGMDPDSLRIISIGERTFEVALLSSPVALHLSGSAPSCPPTLPETADESDLVYGTFLGGGSEDSGHAIAVDDEGNVYVTGETYSTDFPTVPGSFDTKHEGRHDVFVGKLNADGSQLLYGSFLGDSEFDRGYGIAVDGTGSAYVTGETSSPDFPTTPGAFDTSYNGSYDAFVVKLNPAGTGLEYATLLGGGELDSGWDITLDAAGSAHVTGETRSPGFPTTAGAFDESYNGTGNDYDWGDAFVAKLNPAGSTLIYGTFLGGHDADFGSEIAVLGDGTAYVAGATWSPDFPTSPDAFDTTCGSDGNCNYMPPPNVLYRPDAFAVRLDATATELIFGTFLGGSTSERGFGIDVDTTGNAYVTGWVTFSDDFPVTPGAYDTSHNGEYDGFILKLNPAGTDVEYSTFLGGADDDWGNSVAVDGTGCAYVIGLTRSAGFPTTVGAYDTTFNGWEDFFVVKMDPAGSNLVYGTFLGGSYHDYSGNKITVDEVGNAYVTGGTESSGFPTTVGAYDTSYNGGKDAAVAKLALPGHPPPMQYRVFAPLILRSR